MHANEMVGRSCPKRDRRAAGLLLCAIALATGWPQTAHAGWPLAAAARVIVPFGALYQAASGQSQHRGVDLEAATGEEIRAPLSGTVAFVGHVPAAGGGQTLAVTLETTAGRITLLPLEHADVAAGEAVAEAAPIGSLASVGDGSSGVTHLHVGVRAGDLYLDPLGVLVPPSAATAEAGAGQAAGTQAGAGAAAGAGVGQGAHASAGAVAVVIGTVTGSVQAGSAAALRQGGTAGMGVGVSLAPSRAHATGGAPAPAPATASAGRKPSVVPRGAPVAPVAAAALGAGHALAEKIASQPRPSAHDDAHTRTLEVVSAGLSALVGRVRIAAVRGSKLAAYGLLGVLLGVATLWPLWRPAARKGTGKVRVRALSDDVAAARAR
jgi:hypothetical protein